ncbi:hypothetical protein ERJ75_001349200 [Trypanosoma vivax]|nr:hypothetical protein TRVL_03276 [Trypanosoma vivax]KAH8607916.1 hypothetical protein ERJ75_001349200 [Trypanosoma vivax]
MAWTDATDGDIGPGGGKKREKKGFKVDRYENYKKRFAKGSGARQVQRNSANGGNASRVKIIKFDEKDRREFLAMHKRKNERRVAAFVEARERSKRENAKVRRAQREEARQAYNRFASVPILPNYTYRLPTDCSGSVDADCEGLEDEEPDDVERGEGAFRKERETVAKETTVHRIPSSMCGGAEVPNCAAPCSGFHLDDDVVTVEVKPLGLGSARGSTDRPVIGCSTPLPSNDFSDLPSVVEKEMLRLKQETKGPAKTKARVYLMKELEKIRKIKKHSRKGHGKKSAKGKKKNRRH